MKCGKCGNENDNPYVTRKGKIQSYCRKCNNANTVERQRNFKKRLVAYKGGKCQCCGYDKTQDALDFHHIDPSDKSFSLSKIRLTSYDKNREKIERELDKCILVCRNCHAEIHAGVRKPFPQ